MTTPTSTTWPGGDPPRAGCTSASSAGRAAVAARGAARPDRPRPAADRAADDAARGLLLLLPPPDRLRLVVAPAHRAGYLAAPGDPGRGHLLVHAGGAAVRRPRMALR